MEQDTAAILLPTDHWNNRSIKETRDRKPIIILSFQTVLLILYTIFTLTFDYYIDTKSDNPLIKESRSSVVIYFSHLAIRLLFLIIKLYLDANYHRDLKLHGYHKFHKKTTFLSDLIHLLFNKTTLLLLLLSTIYQTIQTESDASINLIGIHLTQTSFAKFITVLMTILISAISGRKLYIEVEFQRANLPPDTITDNDLNDQRQQINEIGLVGGTSNLIEEILEKQFDMIVNLKLQNEHLRELLMMRISESQQSESQQS